jgi:hypothetical protein
MRHRMLHVLGIAALSGTLWGLTPSVAAAAQNCAPPHRMRVVDLNMSPDPVRQGRPIKEVQITMQSDRNGECSMALEVRDQNQIVAQVRAQTIRPGRTVFVLPVVEGYRFQGQDHCFVVQANVGGVFSPIEAQQVFCARLRTVPVWTLKGD